jgi:hypothetical protein
MTPTGPTPQLLPGVAAQTWVRVSGVLGYFTVPGLVGFAALRIFAGDDDPTFNQWFVPIATYLGVTFALYCAAIILSNLRRKKENAAGYTTTWRGDPTLPQLDAVGGTIIRPAGAAYVNRKLWGSQVTNDAAHTSAPPNRPSAWLGLRALIPAVIVLPVATLFVFWQSGWVDGSQLVWLPVAVLAEFGAFAAGYGIGGIVLRRRLAGVRLLAPNELVFTFSKSAEYTKALADVVGQPSYGVEQGGLVASASSIGLTIWHGRPSTALMSIAWPTVSSVQLDSVRTGNNSRPAVLITFATDDGTLVAIPLMNANADGFPIASRRGVRWIIAELEELRTGQTLARLI